MVGVPFNTTQYAFLTIAFARHLGVEPGILIHNISDAHVYESQHGDFDSKEIRPDFVKLLNNWSAICDGRTELKSYNGIGFESVPELEIHSESEDFFSIGDNDFTVDNYHIGYDCYEDLEFPVEV